MILILIAPVYIYICRINELQNVIALIILIPLLSAGVQILQTRIVYLLQPLAQLGGGSLAPLTRFSPPKICLIDLDISPLCVVLNK